MREVGVLLLVFAPLDTILRLFKPDVGWLDVGLSVVIAIVGFALMDIGVNMEAEP
jgi:hypothetical protein